MSPATRTNERPGTRAQLRYLRTSASKARQVLDLIRGESYESAAEILELTERSVKRDIAKLLDSAVANAENNDGLAAEELFISTCYADEGPTLKRWRPRARGRATRINKRTCHITIIVSRYETDELEALQERGAVGSRGREAAARRERVARSRQREAERGEAHEHEHDHEPDGELVDAADSSDVAELTEAEASSAETEAPVVDDDAATDAEVADTTPADAGVASAEAAVAPEKAAVREKAVPRKAAVKKKAAPKKESPTAEATDDTPATDADGEDS